MRWFNETERPPFASLLNSILGPFNGNKYPTSLSFPGVEMFKALKKKIPFLESGFLSKTSKITFVYISKKISDRLSLSILITAAILRMHIYRCAHK